MAKSKSKSKNRRRKKRQRREENKLKRESRMTNKVKAAWGTLVAVIVLMFCACICGLVLGGLISANILLWHWIISML